MFQNTMFSIFSFAMIFYSSSVSAENNIYLFQIENCVAKLSDVNETAVKDYPLEKTYNGEPEDDFYHVSFTFPEDPPESRLPVIDNVTYTGGFHIYFYYPEEATVFIRRYDNRAPQAADHTLLTGERSLITLDATKTEMTVFEIVHPYSTTPANDTDLKIVCYGQSVEFNQPTPPTTD